MPKTVAKKPVKNTNEKKQPKKPVKPLNKKKDSKKPKEQKKEPEIPPESVQSNKAILGEMEEISKKSELPKVKTYEIISDEETAYSLNFEQVKDKLRIKVIEKNSFPPNEFENFYSLEDLIKIDKWFKIFYNIENLIIELEQLTKNESFVIERRKKDCLSLYILFPINLLDKIEIPIPINEIDNKELFMQFISKINEIDAKEKSEINTIDEKLSNLEHLISSMEANNNNQEEENKENENKAENEGLDEQNNQEEGDMKNLEQMKDALKQQIENKIKNKSDNILHENPKEKRKDKNDYLLIDQNEPPFHESTILSENEEERQKEIEYLIEWLSPSLENLPNPPKVLRTKLIYNSDNDGDKAATFHNKCDYISPTLTIIQTVEGYRYGGYTSATWEGEETPKFDSDAFIFSFDTLRKYESLDAEKSIQCNIQTGPNFGGGTIFVPDNFNEEKNYSYHWPSSYNLEHENELTGNKECKINILNYEVYTFELNNDESDKE